MFGHVNRGLALLKQHVQHGGRVEVPSLLFLFTFFAFRFCSFSCDPSV